jgi:hypothetical protein
MMSGVSGGRCLRSIQDKTEEDRRQETVYGNLKEKAAERGERARTNRAAW